MNISTQEDFHELSFYTLAHPDRIYFIHQHIVDAYQAHMANETTKPIGLIFSLIGLYLFIEKGYTGRQVQLAHMKLSNNKQAWPTIELPQLRGNITAKDVLQAQPGMDRDAMIKKWCASVWAAYESSHHTIRSLVKKELDLP